jgi:hypothetical protein
VCKKVHAIQIVGLPRLYSYKSRGGRRRRARLARQSLQALLFVVGYVDEDDGGYVVLGGLENVGNLGET